MAGNLWGQKGKRQWPEMRSLRWPPDATDAGEGAATVTPFEVVPDPSGSGRMIVTPVQSNRQSQESDPEEYSEATDGPEGEDGDMADAEGTEAGATGPGEPRSADAAALIREMRALRRSIETLTSALAVVGSAAPTRPGSGGSSPGANAGSLVTTGSALRSALVPVRDIPDTQAMEEIQNYFLHHQGETIFPAAIADTLGLPLLKVAKLCEILATSGRLSRTL